MGNFAGFESVQLRKPQRSEFDLSHFKRLSMKMGHLVPGFITECVPSDTFHGSSEILVRLAPLLAPIYDNVELYCHFFFVPNRLLWEDWEEFITGGRLGVGVDPVSAPIPPYFSVDSALNGDTNIFDKGTVFDYLGVPILKEFNSTPAAWNGCQVHAMPILAYSLVWYEYYRDRNFFQDDYVEFPVMSGDMIANYASGSKWLKYTFKHIRNYEHDYFTSALPFTQRGEEVLMPLAGTGSVTYLAKSIVANTAGTPVTGTSYYLGNAAADGGLGVYNKATGVTAGDAQLQNIDEVNIENSSVSINDFRSAYALQVWLERNAVGGSRYTESTQAHFGVRPQDSRLQRPEYIGGGRIPVKISEVVSTAYSTNADSDTIPLANLGGHGITYGNTNRFNYFCTEHGFIIGIISIMNKPSYHQGMPRMFFARRSFLDYPWPTFAKLGEQEVHKAELWADPTNLKPDTDGNFTLFGYQSRYADWKYICSTNRGDFHDDLLFWTLTRDFASDPELGVLFNEFNVNTQNRIFAAGGTADGFWLYIHNRVSVRRPLPYFGTPNTLGFS